MYIIIDGYNLIKQLFNTSTVSEKKRNTYVRKLIDKADAKGHHLIVVFDGGTYGFPTEERMLGHLVLYSGYKESADDVIKKYASDNRDKDMLVVTSDREIRTFVHNLGVQTIDSLGFDKLFSQQAVSTETTVVLSDAPTVKTSASDNKEVDELMNQLGGESMVKDDDVKAKQQSLGYKESKKDKKKRKKLSKL